MKYISLKPHHVNSRFHPVAKQINEIMHDGINNACINYLDRDNLRNQLNNVNDDQFNDAVNYLIKHHDLIKQHYRGRTFFTLN